MFLQERGKNPATKSLLWFNYSLRDITQNKGLAVQLPVIYALFAVIATIANIGVQDFSIRLYSGPFSLIVSMAAGTLVGLFTKYVLDKRYIFRFDPRDIKHDAHTFFLYMFMGLITTLVFWGTEATFHALFETKAMRYLGAIIGLALGYIAKYWLDRKYVFG